MKIIFDAGKKGLFLALVGILGNLFSMPSAYPHACGRRRSDMRMDQPGYSVQHLKNRFQYYDICYAHAATDMVDAYRFHHNGDKNYSHLSSPLALAIANANLKKRVSLADDDAKSFEIGNICSAVNTLFQAGSCSFKDVDRKIYQNVLKNNPVCYEDDSRKLKDFFDGLHGRFLQTKSETANKKVMASELLCYFKNHHSSSAETKGSITTFVPESKTVAQALEQKYYLDFLQQFISGYCPQPLNIGEAPECKEFYPKFLKTSNMSQKIHGILDRKSKALPIGIDFCERILLSGKRGTQPLLDDGEKCIRHATVIIGRRSKNNRCQLLLKNTSFCNSTVSKYECEKETGKVWVDEEDLLESTYGIHYFK